jgi:hypothetical protein
LSELLDAALEAVALALGDELGRADLAALDKLWEEVKAGERG